MCCRDFTRLELLWRCFSPLSRILVPAQLQTRKEQLQFWYIWRIFGLGSVSIGCCFLMAHVVYFCLYVWFSGAGVILAAGPGPSCAEFPWKVLQSVPKTCFHLFVKVQFAFIIARSVREKPLSEEISDVCITRLVPGFQVGFSGPHLPQSQRCLCTNAMMKGSFKAPNHH